jgi:hypothetical protein
MRPRAPRAARQDRAAWFPASVLLSSSLAPCHMHVPLPGAVHIEVLKEPERCSVDRITTSNVPATEHGSIAVSVTLPLPATCSTASHFESPTLVRTSRAGPTSVVPSWKPFWKVRLIYVALGFALASPNAQSPAKSTASMAPGEDETASCGSNAAPCTVPVTDALPTPLQAPLPALPWLELHAMAAATRRVQVDAQGHL